MATAKTIRKERIAVKHKDWDMWGKAIDYLESELRQTHSQERIAQLKAAINTFRANLKRRMPWPTESATQH